MKIWPAIVAVPERALPELLVVALSVTVPRPVSDAPDVTVIQGSLLVAVHAHAGAAETNTFVVPAPAPVETLTGDSEYVQLPSCVIWKSFPPTAIVPLRTV